MQNPGSTDRAAGLLLSGEVAGQLALAGEPAGLPPTEEVVPRAGAGLLPTEGIAPQHVPQGSAAAEALRDALAGHESHEFKGNSRQLAGDRAPRREGEVTPEEQIDDEELEFDAMIQPGEGSPSPERETHEEYSSAPGGPLRNPVTWHAYSAPSSSSSSAPPARSRLEGARSEADWRERKHEQPGSPTTPRGFRIPQGHAQRESDL